MISTEDFGKLFDTFRREAFRLETLDRYDVPEEAEAFARFQAGGPKPEGWGRNDWARRSSPAQSLTAVIRTPR